MLSRRAEEAFIPDMIKDNRRGKSYSKGRFLGKGGFARCYELTDTSNGNVYAGKIVPKSLLTKTHQQQKMVQEIEIHRTLFHPHIVHFHSFFEDDANVYITLELCRRRSLMELHRRRKVITEPEARYFMSQIVTACVYLHQRGVIHRDLKLGNLFLNDDMQIKIGDFGLAATIEKNGERKRTLCGTPNYIAPEILNKCGHSFEVDIWSLGCILYTLLVGRPPFETTSLKDTYSKIRSNDYFIPHGSMSESAAALIKDMLQLDPIKRPTIARILDYSFFIAGPIPSHLPASCCSVAPRFADSNASTMGTLRRPLQDCNVDRNYCVGSPARGGMKENLTPTEAEAKHMEADDPYHIHSLERQVREVIDKYRGGQHLNDHLGEEAEDPALVPFLWVSKWVDYSDKYGLGYQLCDDSVGIVFNDNTRLIQLARDSDDVQYISRNGEEFFFKLRDRPSDLTKKLTLLNYFKNYMQEHLVKAGEMIPTRPVDPLTRLPFIRAWFRTRNAIVMHLSNGTLQVNFFQDHIKMILCPVMGAMTLISENQDFKVYNLSLILQYGCTESILTHLRYTLSMINRIISSKASGRLRSTS